MASANPRAELNCSLCLDIYTDPVNLNCGHNFCKLCIGKVLDEQKGSGIYSCPECRVEQRERPRPYTNTTLTTIVEQFRCHQPAEDVTGITCTYCVHAPTPAAKTCLLCEASLCETHLKVHSQSPEHVLTEPTTSLERWKCSIHKEMLKYYCTEDATCICVSCSLAGKHKGHKVETLNEAYEKKKQRMRAIMDKLNKQKEDTEEKIQSLTKDKKDVEKKADHIKGRVTAQIMNIRKQLDNMEKKVLIEISTQKEQVSKRISDLIQQLEKKKSEISKEMDHIEELQKMTEPLAILQAQKQFKPGDVGALKQGKIQDLNMNEISGTLQAGLADVITGIKKISNIMEIDKSLDANMSPDISLDVNTASNDLIVSSDLKTVSSAPEKQNRPETPKRFDGSPQVLSTSGFTSGRHYLEMETSEDGWIIGMAYPSIERKRQPDLSYGRNNAHYNQWNQTWQQKILKYAGDNKSWRLCLDNDMFSVLCDGKVTELNRYPSSQRLGIFLDYEAGRLSFYELGDAITCVHSINATFTKPLHVAICVWGNGSVKIIN